VNKVAFCPWGQVYAITYKSFLASRRINGERKQKRFGTVVDAVKWMVEVIGPASQFVQPQAQPQAPVAQAQQPSTASTASKPVTQAVADYLEDIAGSLGKSTVSDYRQYLSKLQVETLAGLTPEYVRGWLRQWEGKPTSQQHAMRALSAFWNWCSESDWCKKADNPVASLDGVKRRIKREKNKQRKTISVWTPEEMEKVYRKALELDPRIKGWFVCCAWLGLRPQEALRVTRDDLHDDCLTIPPDKAKSSQGRYRTIEFKGVLEEAGKVLQEVEWFGEDQAKASLVPWTEAKAPQRIVTAAAEACNVERGHDVLRHTCASYLSILVGEEKCSRMLGHSVEVERGHYNGRRTEAEARRYYDIKL
jgi:integrase